MPKKVFIRTFGCQMNEYDSDKMADVLAGSEGVVKTENPEEADIIRLTGDVTFFVWPRSVHCVRIDRLSLPTGIDTPSCGHSSIPTARTVS